jgi:hypothetical protein
MASSVLGLVQNLGTVNYLTSMDPSFIYFESTFDVGCRSRCTMRVDCGEFDPGMVISAERGEWYSCLLGFENRSWRSGVMRPIGSPPGESARA